MKTAHPFNDFARHVVKFADGTYLPYNLRYESRVTRQRFAHRWLTWASAKMIADSDALVGTGARAVRLKERTMDTTTSSRATTCRAIRCGGCDTELRSEDGDTLSVRACKHFVIAHSACRRLVGDVERTFTPEAEVLQDTGEWRWADPSSMRSLGEVEVTVGGL